MIETLDEHRLAFPGALSWSVRTGHTWRRDLDYTLRERALATREAIDHATGVYFPARVHAARIAIKKMRYAMEIAHAIGRRRSKCRNTRAQEGSGPARRSSRSAGSRRQSHGELSGRSFRDREPCVAPEAGDRRRVPRSPPPIPRAARRDPRHLRSRAAVIATERTPRSLVAAAARSPSRPAFTQNFAKLPVE